MDPITVAIDVGPLHGHRTGVGLAVDHLTTALRLRFDVALYPYVVSFRAAANESEHRLPIPAGVATRLWARGDRPRADRWLPGVNVVHGTNYVAPPSRLPTVVSVYDLWFLQHRGEQLRRGESCGSGVATCGEARRVRARQLGRDGRGGPRSARDRSRRGRASRAPAASRPQHLEDPGLGIDGRPFVLAIGTFERRKSLTTLVAAFGHLADTLGDSAARHGRRARRRQRPGRRGGRCACPLRSDRV